MSWLIAWARDLRDLIAEALAVLNSLGISAGPPQAFAGAPSSCR
ncbi:hypothetical protein [Streptomyces sp. NPDC090021]